MSMSPKEYDKLSKAASPPTNSLKNCLFAFVIGGAICTLGQALSNLYMYWFPISRELASTFASVSLIFLAVLLTGLALFDNLARYAGAGTLVPITGFANAMSSAAIEFRSEGVILGLGAKLFVIAGPVLVYGLSAAVAYGFILYLLQMVGG